MFSGPVKLQVRLPLTHSNGNRSVRIFCRLILLATLALATVQAAPPDSQAKPILVRALQLMGQVIEEGRHAVRGLRASESASLDLEHAFSLIRQDMVQLQQAASKVEFRVIVDGPQRPLRPLLRDEAYRIGREALTNAFRHARANKIEIELKYSTARLRMVVRDDGCGIDPKIMRSGRDGHWGLSGMRERADQIGAQFRVWSNVAAGTEVELSIPSHIAFEDHRNQMATWIGKTFRRASESRTPDAKNGKGK